MERLGMDDYDGKQETPGEQGMGTKHEDCEGVTARLMGVILFIHVFLPGAYSEWLIDTAL